MTVVNLKVIDISHHNDIQSFDKIYDFGIRGIIHKASQGTGVVDKMYEKRRQAALDAGLLWGAYHFATGDDVDEQVAHFLAAAEPDEHTLMALDHEPYNGNQLDLDGAQAFLESGRDQLGRKLKLYSGNLIKEQLGNKPSEFFGSHQLWLAQYGQVAKVPAAWKAPWLWQFSGDGVSNRGIIVPGVSRGNTIDMNSFDGSDEELAAQWA